MLHLVSNNFVIKCDGNDAYQEKGRSKTVRYPGFLPIHGRERNRMPKKTRDTKLSQRKKFVWFKDDKQWAFAAQENWGQLGKKKISIDIPGENNYKIIGENMSWEFEILKDDDQVAAVLPPTNTNKMQDIGFHGTNRNINFRDRPRKAYIGVYWAQSLLRDAIVRALSVVS